MEAGQLPHFSRLCASGSWGPLRTTFPPVSPVAWTTCLTGAHPSKHGIHDFVTKAPRRYLPEIGLYDVQSGGGALPTYARRCRVPTLGALLAEAGRTAYLLKVPGTFPPEPMPARARGGGILAGFGMPDLVGSFGVSAWYTTDVAGKRAGALEDNGLIQGLERQGRGAWRGQIEGPAKTSLAFTLRRARGQAALSLGARGGQPVVWLSPGEWSGWVRLLFEVPGLGAVPGICRFKLVSLGRRVELYRTAVQCAPDLPLYPLSEPAGLAGWLERLTGPYATIGMPGDLDGVRRGVVDRGTFLEDAYANWEQQVEQTLRLACESSWDLLMTHLFAIDNVQHLFWGDRSGEVERGPVADGYRWMDAQLGRLTEALPNNTTVMVVSDHGGLPIERLAFLNAWLRSAGYLVERFDRTGGGAAQTRLAPIDWTRTRAAMYGTGAIWLNVQGREPQGIVPPGAAYEGLRSEIAGALLGWRDGETGQAVVKRVFRGEEVFGVGCREAGPDLVLALQPGYGLGRGEGLGRVRLSQSTVVANETRWRGGHEGPYLPEDVPGVCVISQPGVDLEGVGLEDVAPMVMALLGATFPEAALELARTRLSAHRAGSTTRNASELPGR
jgi:predicted AlkP superfamily phosphohydrolase/phosphomutase